MLLEVRIEMEKYQIACVPIPTNESQWDENAQSWRSRRVGIMPLVMIKQYAAG